MEGLQEKEGAGAAAGEAREGPISAPPAMVLCSWRATA